MSSVLRSAGVLAIVIAGVALAPVTASAQTSPGKDRGARGHVHQRHRADLPELLSGLPSARPDGADVAAHVSGRPAVGALDQAARRRARRCRRGASTRTSASRASRTIRRCAQDEIDKIAKWVDAGAPMGNAADMPKPREFDDSRSLAHRQARSHRHLAAAQGAGRSVRLVGQLLRRHRPHRGPLHQGDREQAREDRRRASPAHLRGRRRRERRQQRRRQQRATPANSSTSSPSARTAICSPKARAAC